MCPIGTSASSDGSTVSVTVTAKSNCSFLKCFNFCPAVDQVKRELDNVLRENQVKLCAIFTETEETLKEIARELNAVNIIGKPVLRSPKYDAMIGSFVNGINLKEDISDIEEHCVKFLKSLSNVEGPVADASGLIKKKWKEAVKDKCGLELKI